MTSHVKHVVLPEDLPISVYPDKGYLMDNCTVSRDSINHHDIIIISWRRSTNASSIQKARRQCPLGCFYSEGDKSSVLKHDHTVRMFLKVESYFKIIILKSIYLLLFLRKLPLPESVCHHG